MKSVKMKSGQNLKLSKQKLQISGHNEKCFKMKSGKNRKCSKWKVVKMESCQNEKWSK